MRRGGSLRRRPRRWEPITLTCTGCGVQENLTATEHADLVLWTTFHALTDTPRVVRDGGNVTSGQFGLSYRCPPCESGAKASLAALFRRPATEQTAPTGAASLLRGAARALDIAPSPRDDKRPALVEAFDAFTQATQIVTEHLRRSIR